MKRIRIVGTVPGFSIGISYGYARLRIRHFRTARLSADDRRIAVLNSAFEVFSG